MKFFFTIALMLYSASLLAGESIIEDITFDSHAEQLSGSIVYPKNKIIHSAVVFVHGSGPQIRNLHWAKRFSSAGIAALVYDKRGVGKSGGTYEAKQSVSGKNIKLLADDAVSALQYLNRHSVTKKVPIGLAGISQAGWIVPVAAQHSEHVDFLVLWSGPVCKVSEEDIYSKYTSDLDNHRPPSFADALKSRRHKYVWPDFLGRDTDSSRDLASLKIPGLWVYGLKDGSVPVDLSVQRLNQLIDSDHKYEYVLFSEQGHNNMSDTFSIATDWIKKQNK